MSTPESVPDRDTGPAAGHESDAKATANTNTNTNTNANADSATDSATDGEVDWIREAFAREAFGVTPSPVPLEAVRRAGRSRRSRRTATFSALSVVAAATGVAAVVGVTYTRPSPPAPAQVAASPATVTPRVPPPTSRPTPTRTAARTPTPVRVVTSGERVDAGKGWKVWLTAEGKHWTGPDGYENTRSVTDGNVDTAVPGVSHQTESSAAGAFHSGLYYGTRAVGRVELTGSGGTRIAATLLELPARPGWGVWYAHTGPTGAEASVAMYDRAGRLLTNLPG
ncbi:hypothetical protein ACFWVF_15590 [Streptomyces sp. NPDC058659]|uniref:hypothetical protein n=1 Tax=unclassified Streptomyces TaxID=2593676 RepID=UPI003651EC06